MIESKYLANTSIDIPGPQRLRRATITMTALGEAVLREPNRNRVLVSVIKQPLPYSDGATVSQREPYFDLDCFGRLIPPPYERSAEAMDWFSDNACSANSTSREFADGASHATDMSAQKNSAEYIAWVASVTLNRRSRDASSKDSDIFVHTSHWGFDKELRRRCKHTFSCRLATHGMSAKAIDTVKSHLVQLHRKVK